MEENVAKSDEFDYSSIDALEVFKASHPKVMQRRIESINWRFDFDPTKNNFGLKAKLLNCIEKHTGWRIGEYKNYKLLK